MKLQPVDRDLWDAFKEGDSTAFGQIYNDHIIELLNYGYRVTSDRQLIKDSIHDLFLHLWLHRSNLSEVDSIKHYLFRALRNRVLQNLSNSIEARPKDIAGIMDALFAENSLEQTLIEEETESDQINALKKAINLLPVRQQEVIQLRYYHDFSLEEIASVMGINNQSVRNLLHRSIVLLRNIFETAGRLMFLLFSFL